MNGRRISSGGPWEDLIGYSRAVGVGPWLFTSGCTSTVDGAVVGVGDPYLQARTAFGIGLEALGRAGAGPEHVVRTRMYVTDIAHLEEIGRAHKELFDVARPATTMVAVAALAHPDHLVEVEIEAYLPDGPA
jgi:enamine deaminase RidA (YjgF/YER057c/UK114 family)